MKRDIGNREDILFLMEQFYEKLLADPTISYFFTEVARIDILQHLPVLVDFWGMVLSQADTYRKNVLQLHMTLNKKSSLSKEHFNTWLRYFKQTVDDLFEGEKAFLVKERAESIATIMQIKLARPQSPG